MLASIPDTGAGWPDVGTVPTEFDERSSFQVLSRARFKFLGWAGPGRARLRPRDRDSHAYLRPKFALPPAHGRLVLFQKSTPQPRNAADTFTMQSPSNIPSNITPPSSPGNLPALLITVQTDPEHVDLQRSRATENDPTLCSQLLCRVPIVPRGDQ